jgi:hypothetical protein
VIRGGSSLTWNIGTLNTNAGAQLTVTVRPIYVDSFTSYAIVQADTPDPNPSDDFASATINATNAAAVTPPQLLNPVVAPDGTFQFSVSGPSDQTNVVQSSTNLVNWLSIYTNVGPFTYTNVIDPGYPVEFYRYLILGP